MNVDDLNLAAGTFRVMGKGGFERVGYLADDTSKLIRRYLRERGNPKAGPLFASREGRLSYAMVHRKFRQYSNGIRCAGEPVTIHQLRHTFAHYWMLDGGGDDALMRHMGWKSREMLSRYAVSAGAERALSANRQFGLGSRF